MLMIIARHLQSSQIWHLILHSHHEPIVKACSPSTVQAGSPTYVNNCVHF